MDVGWYYNLALLLICIIFSALFSGSEVSLFSLDLKKIKNSYPNKGIVNTYITSLLEYPRRLLVTILLGNTLFNVAASIVAVNIALELAYYYQVTEDLALLIQIIILTFLILLFGEITPKVWASKNPLSFAKFVAVPIYWISILIYPATRILTELIRYISSKLKYNKSHTAITSTELAELANLGVEKGTIDEDEQGLITGLVTFKEITVREVMTPRVDIIAVPINSEFVELMELITGSGHSRLPLYDENLDNILGVIYAKDLLPYVGNSENREKFNIKKIARKPMFIPDSKLISELMHEFQEKNTHLGIVVDEYGGTAGLISLEDILEEIVGEIRDEYDQEENEIVNLEDGKYLVLGKVPIDEINEILEVDLSSENDDYDTMGGFIFNHAGNIPDENYSLEYLNYKFSVKEVINKRIKKVLIEKIK